MVERGRGGVGCSCGSEPDAGCLGAGENGGSGLFVVATLLLTIMHKVAWAEAYNP